MKQPLSHLPPVPYSRAALLEGAKSLTHLPSVPLFIFHGRIHWLGERGKLFGRGKKASQLCLGYGQSQVPNSTSLWQGPSAHCTSIPEQLTPPLGLIPRLWPALEPLVQIMRWCRDDPWGSSSVLGLLPPWHRNYSGRTLFCSPCALFPPGINLWRASCTLLQESPKQKAALGPCFICLFQSKVAQRFTCGRHSINYFTQ